MYRTSDTNTSPLSSVSAGVDITILSDTGYLDYARAMALIDDAGTVQELLVMLNDSLATDLQSLESAALTAQWLDVSPILHRLKGVLPLFCDQKTADLLADLDLQFTAGRSQVEEVFLPSTGVLAKFPQCLKRLIDFQASLQKWLSGRSIRS